MSLPYLFFYGVLGYLLFFAITRWREFRQALAQISHYPGERPLFGITSLLGGFLPNIPYVTLGGDFTWRTKYKVFEKLGTDIYGTASVFPPVSYLTLADPEAIKHVSYPRNNFIKHTVSYEIFKLFGSNLLIVEGEEWRRQRRIVTPAFSDKNNRLVWDTAKGHIKRVFDSWESKKPTIIHNVKEDLTLPLSLSVISKAGYGLDASWVTNAIPAGHKLTFEDAFLTSCKTLNLPLMLPNWAWGLRKEWRRAKLAHEELRLYLQEMIATRREPKEQEKEPIDQRHDLLNRLIHARDDNDTLTEDELIGNMFIFFFGGHETSAHTLAITLSLLALYPEVQDKLLKQIRELEQEHGDLTYDHSQLITYAMAVIYEAMRLYPMVPLLPKQATADTTVTVGLAPNTQTIQVPKSTMVQVFSTGLHYNPNYWENPEEFNPERFMDPHWNRDAFISFSVGPRACIGRRFSETALTAELSTLISKYRVSVDESRFKSIKGESILERRARLINPDIRLTLTPAPISLVFSPRD